MKLLLVLLSALGLAGLAATAQKDPPKDPLVVAYQDLVATDLRLATIGYHLAKGSAPFCRNRWRNPGWVLHDEWQYPDAAFARRAFIFRQPVSVAALVAEGPAAQAGIATGDGIVQINGVGYRSTPKSGRASAERIDTLRQAIATRLATGALTLELETADGPRALTLSPPEICASDFWVDVRGKRDAGADGERVRVTSGLIAYVLDDDELAAVVAHEMAHNLLDHRARITAAKRGKTAIVRATEEEADRLSVWLMANAGYDPQAAITFWERYGADTGLGIFSAPTHYRWQTRVAMLREEITRMDAIAAMDGRRDPPLLAAHRAAR